MDVTLFEDMARGDNLEPKPPNRAFLHAPYFRNGAPKLSLLSSVIGYEKVMGGSALE